MFQQRRATLGRQGWVLSLQGIISGSARVLVDRERGRALGAVIRQVYHRS